MKIHQNILMILKYIEAGLSQRECTFKVDVSKTTVQRILRKSRELNLHYQDLIDLGEEEIMELFYPKLTSEKDYAPIDFDYVHKRLNDNGNIPINLSYLWTEYATKVTNPYSYSQFCRLYKKWKKEIEVKPVFTVHRIPGEKIYIDWMGTTLIKSFTENPNIEVKLYFFLTTLGLSSYPYIEAFTNMGQNNYIKGVVNAIEYYGGVSKFLVPDNCKTAIIENDNYNFKANKAFEDLEQFYGTIILPTGVEKPKHKPSVEKAVQDTEIWFINKLVDRQFSNIRELNLYLFDLLKEFSNKPFQKKKDETRESLFIKYDKPNLKPLPHGRFVICQYEIQSVPPSYHVKWNDQFYSVPYDLINQEVTLKVYEDNLDVFHDGKLIVSHKIYELDRKYHSIKEHMPASHQFAYDAMTQDKSYYLNQAESIGIYCLQVMNIFLNSQKHVEQTYKACASLLGLLKYYTKEEIDFACLMATKNNNVVPTSIKAFCQSQKFTSLSTSSDSPEIKENHTNIRGKDAFK